MRCIIAGGRNITDYKVVEKAILESGWADEITEEVCGMAKGADLLGKQWADTRGIPVVPFEVTKDDWRIYGLSAGPIRNEAMAMYADALILVWDGQSSGSRNMKEWAEHYGLKIYPYIVKSAVKK